MYKKTIVGQQALQARRERAKKNQLRNALKRKAWINKNSYYYNLLKKALGFIVENRERTLNIRCQTGWMLSAIRPKYGVGWSSHQKW